MEEYPTACQSKDDAASLNPEYFQIKDEATGLVLEINEDGVAFAESTGLSKQVWFWYREYNSEAPEGEVHIINKMNNRMLMMYGTETDEFKGMSWGNTYYLGDKPYQMWKKADGGKVYSTKEGYTVLAVKDEELVVLKEGTDSTVVISKAPEETLPLAPLIEEDNCTDPPPPPEGKSYHIK